MIHHTRKPEDAHLDGAQPAFCVMKPLQQHIAGVKFLVLKEILNTIAVIKPQTNELWYGYVQLLFYRNQINSGGGGVLKFFPNITGGT